MDYVTALKKVQTEKIKDNYMVLEFGYDHKILLPHKDGSTVLTALVNAERLKESYGDPIRITELERDMVKIQTMSRIEYERIKVATLLGLPVTEVKEMMEAATKLDPTP